MRKGAARLMPINSICRYIPKPNAAAVAITALMLPRSPSHGFDRTVSPIIHVTTLWQKKLSKTRFYFCKIYFFSYLKMAIKMKVELK